LTADAIAETKQRFTRVAAAATLSLSILAVTPSAQAVEHHPKGAFAPFADCPLSLVSLNTCIVAEIGSGAFSVGRKTVPIGAKLTFQGGLLEDVEAATRLDFIAAEDGNTLSKTALSVPGGLTGVVAAGYLPKALREAFNRVSQNTTGVTLTAELARPASAIALDLGNLLKEEGVGLRLPVKAKLSNPFLGANCYIGSSSNPIVLNLTTGVTSPPAPNRPIKGTFGPLSFPGEGLVLDVTSVSLVDNAFATPRASGCGGGSSALVDPAIDAQLGLPAPAGHNTAILNAKIELSGAETVREKE
jgi:hypothetical protein